MQFKYPGFAISAILISVTLACGKKIVLDKDLDKTREFLQIDCYYTSNYDDFWVWGCGNLNKPSVGPVSSGGGFWSSCQKDCQIIYNTGIQTEVKSILIEGFVHGSAGIQVSGTASPVNLTIWEPITTINSSPEWFSTSIDVSELTDIFVYNINSIGSLDGYVLIDKVVIDFGDDVTDPPTPPPATTPQPPEKTGIITLDELDDNPKYWREVHCHYAHHFDDFGSAWGCPTGVPSSPDDVPSSGYWTSCQRDSCEILYYGSIIGIPTATVLSVHVQGAGEIQVFGRRSLNEDPEVAQPLYTITVPRENNVQTFCNNVPALDLTTFPNIYVLSFKLVSGGQDSFALVDKISVHIIPEIHDEPVSSIVGNVACALEVKEPTTTTTTTTTGPVTKPPNVAASNRNGLFTITATLMMIPMIKYIVF